MGIRRVYPAVMRFIQTVVVFGLCLVSFFVGHQRVTRSLDGTSLSTFFFEQAQPEICIVTALYGDHVEQFDSLPEPPKPFRKQSDFRFYVFTNQPLYRPPWPWIPISSTTGLQLSNLTRWVTKSRYGKFLAWREPHLERCKCILYQDAIISIKGSPDWFRHISKVVSKSPIGLMQNPNPYARAGLRDEFRVIVQMRKDSAEHVNASLTWLLQQPDFEDSIVVFGNTFFAYNPKSIAYRRLSQTFWDLYASEQFTIRDQPFWSFLLWRFNMTPLQFPLEPGELYKAYHKRRGFGGHKYVNKTKEE